MAAASEAAGRAAVFLDRDGVLNLDVGYAFRVEDLTVLPGVPKALAALKAKGFLLVVVSNQSGVARGLYDEAALAAFNAELQARIVKAGGPPFDDVLWCPHHPEGKVAAWRATCDCRKPGIGMITEATRRHGVDLARSWLVGDKYDDVECAVRAGLRAVQIRGRPGEPRHPKATAHAESLLAATTVIG
jgi:D-glycero-D-manno-heptose 1,7-bisphosphate phosphatase